ncbi:MAG: hypothetical protein JWL69_3663, partial [Phycisphaerales bacterium]|nr:hypothetical protein [Phycisphaerales bacterium]
MIETEHACPRSVPYVMWLLGLAAGQAQGLLVGGELLADGEDAGEVG